MKLLGRGVVLNNIREYSKHDIHIIKAIAYEKAYFTSAS